MLPAGSSPLSQGMEVDPPRLGEPPREQDDDLSEGSGVGHCEAVGQGDSTPCDSIWFLFVKYLSFNIRCLTHGLL